MWDGGKGGGRVKRLGRWTLNALTVLSLVLCVVTVALWVRAGWVEEQWFW